MTTIQLSDDELAACRAKGAQKVEQLLSVLQDQPEKEKFDRLHVLFEAVALRWDHCGENFAPIKEGVFEFRSKDDQHVDRSVEELALLLKGKVCSEAVLETTLQVMGSLEVTRYNGELKTFNECAKRLADGPKSSPVEPFPSNIVLPETLAAAYK